MINEGLMTHLTSPWASPGVAHLHQFAPAAFAGCGRKSRTISSAGRAWLKI
jgi:hypothetical protein